MRSSTDSEEGEAPGATLGGSPSPELPSSEGPSLVSLARRHPRVATVSLVVLIAVVAVTLLTTVSNPRRQPLSDAANCSQWAAATSGQQISYAHLYIDEYGRVANTARNAASVRASVNAACVHASYLGEATDISILAALRHAF